MPVEHKIVYRPGSDKPFVQRDLLRWFGVKPAGARPVYDASVHSLRARADRAAQENTGKVTPREHGNIAGIKLPR